MNEQYIDSIMHGATIKERDIHWECTAKHHILPHIHLTRRIMVATQSTFVKHVQKNKQHIY